MFKIVDFIEEHIQGFKDNGIEKDILNDKYIYEYIGCSNRLKTFMLDDKPEGFAGLVEINSDTAQIWAVINEKLYAHKKSLIKVLKNEIIQLNYIRLQTFCIEELEKTGKFIEVLGFKKEGSLEKFYQGKNYAVYGKVKG